MCNRCPVIDACLAAALAEERHIITRAYGPHGVRGGLVPSQRRELIRHARRNRGH
jgi:hypothetical protein